MPDRSQRVFLWATAIVLPLLLVVAGNALFWRLTERASPDTTGILLFQLGLTAFPFVLLATVAMAAKRLGPPWTWALATGAFVSTGLWMTYYIDGYIYWRDHLATGSGGGGGVDFGIIFLMLFSPLVVGGAMFVAFRVARLRA